MRKRNDGVGTVSHVQRYLRVAREIACSNAAITKPGEEELASKRESCFAVASARDKFAANRFQTAVVLPAGSIDHVGCVSSSYTFAWHRHSSDKGP